MFEGKSPILMVSKPIVPPWNDSGKNLVRDIAAHGEQFRYHLMTTPAHRDEVPGAVAETIYRDGGSFAPGLLQNARVLARLFKPDAIPLYHFFFAPNPRTSTVARTVFRLKRRRVVHTICSAPRSFDGLKKILFADQMVVLSRETESRFRDAGVENIRVIPPGIRVTDPVGDADKQAVRTELGLDQRPIVLFAGDYEFSGACRRVLEVARNLSSKLEVQIVYACRHKTPQSLEIEAGLKAEVESGGLQSRVRFVGQVQRIEALLAAADLLLMPSESLFAKMDLPLVLLEGMAQRTPLIVADVAPLNELLGDPAEPPGLAVATDDIPGYCSAVERLLSDDDLRCGFGENARNLVRTRYDIRTIARLYEELYTEMLEGK